MKIESVEVRVVAPEVQRYTWSHDLPEQYMTNTVVRITTDTGVEGVAGVSNYTSYGFDRYTAETIRHIAPILIGQDPLLGEAISRAVWPRVFPLSPGALAVVDVALWDLRGRHAGLPLYQLLGGARDRIAAYASTPLLEDISAYLRCVADMLGQGFTAVKFHAWCLPDKDLELCRAVRQEFPDDSIAFMHDAENNYDRRSALRVGQELDDLGFNWFEAPLPDYDLEGYRELNSQCRIPVLPSGNWIQDLPAFAHAIHSKAWKVARTDVTACGGMTTARKAMNIAEAAGINCEIMCWGNTLVSAANLHLMLAFRNGTYFEQSVPYDSYEYGMQDVIRTQPDGYVYAPQKPGLGVDVDWEAMEAATINSYRVDEATC